MSYGVNKPAGLEAIKSVGGWDGEIGTYPILSGYASNIMQGDAVFMKDGALKVLSDAEEPDTQPILGSFLGYKGILPTAVQPFDPANPGGKFWKANTNLVGARPATAMVTDAKQVTYSIQVDSTGLSWTAQGQTCALSFADPADLDFLTGISSMTIKGSSVGSTAAAPLRILRFVQPPQQVIPQPGNNNRFAYINAEVMVQNHQLYNLAVGE